MRFSILLILFLSSVGNYSLSANPENSTPVLEEYSLLELKSMICSKQWSQSSNENHVFIFNHQGSLEVFRMTEEDKLSATQLLYSLELENGKQILNFFNTEFTRINSFNIVASNNRLSLKSIDTEETINLVEKKSTNSRNTEKLIGDWRGRQLIKKTSVRKEKYEQEEVRFNFHDNGAYSLESKNFNSKVSKELGSYIVLADSDSVILKPNCKFKRPYLIKLKHISDSELVLSVLNNKEKVVSSSLTLLK
jgi:hypothetical protein